MTEQHAPPRLAPWPAHRNRAPIPTSNRASERVHLSIAVALDELATREAEGLGISRSQFLRLLVDRLMGRTHLERPAKLPKPKPLRAGDHEMTTVPLNLDPEAFAFLEDLANRCGNASRSTIISLMVLEWAGILPALFPARRG